jgi:hypothetical protein
MSELSTKKAIEHAINKPELARNLRGQLAAAFRFVDQTSYKHLALDYAEHIIWICEEVYPHNDIFRRAIDVTRRYLRGETKLEEVWQIRLELSRLVYELEQSSHHGVTYAAKVIEGAILVCCHEELKKAKYVHQSAVRPRFGGVAHGASDAVKRYTAGIDWDADDIEVRTAARKQAYAASDKETAWQITCLLEYFESSPTEKK